MRNLRPMILAMLVSALGAVCAASGAVGGPAPAEPVVVQRAAFPINVGGGDYDLVTVVLDFAPGAGTGTHRHGGHVLVSVLSGELTLHDKGGARAVKAGESWTERPGDVHSVENAGSAAARVAASFLLPKGAELTTPVK